MVEGNILGDITMRRYLQKICAKTIIVSMLWKQGEEQSASYSSSTSVR